VGHELVARRRSTSGTGGTTSMPDGNQNDRSEHRVAAGGTQRWVPPLRRFRSI
jgi:hypothetical protein